MSDHPLPEPTSKSPDWEAIARYLAGNGSPEERRAFEQEMNAHPERAKLLADLGQLGAVKEPMAPSAAEVEMALKSVLVRRDVSSIAAPKVVSLDAHRRTRWTPALRAAAAIIVVAGAGVLWRSTTRSAPGNSAEQHFASAVGAIDSVTLNDGTRVLLGPGSQLTVAAGFGESSRELTLVGEARFNVHHDAAKPFVVHTEAAEFRDVGTVFSVHSDGNDGASVVVTEGAVNVTTTPGNAGTILRKGDRASVVTGGNLDVKRSALAPDDTAWVQGRLIFRDAPVSQVVADVKRWYGIDVRVDSSLAAHRVSAQFDRGAGSDVGRVVAALLGGGFRQDGNTLYIVPPAAAAPK